jgi:hypothetical protein
MPEQDEVALPEAAPGGGLARVSEDLHPVAAMLLREVYRRVGISQVAGVRVTMTGRMGGLRIHENVVVQ